MGSGQRLTGLAHEAVATVAGPGDLVVDATAGNGHDTLALARVVGATGRVFAFDIQQAALDRTRLRLAEHGLEDRVTLLGTGHERLRDALPRNACGRLAAIMFNLGYLPGGDKRLITRAASTLAALFEAETCLRPGGILTVVAYAGHQGGDEELAAVDEWFIRGDSLLEDVRRSCPGGVGTPVLFSGRRQAGISRSTGEPAGSDGDGVTPGWQQR